jgi:hypothetical protein
VTRRRWLGGALALVLVGATAAACGSSSDGAGNGEVDAPTGRPDPVGEVLDLSGDGIHALTDPPIADRASNQSFEVVAWADDELLVWGGHAGEGASDPGRVLGDGASLSLEDGRWTPLPPSPFPDGLYRPLGAWDGTELIVIGTWCEADIPPVTDGSPPPCPEGPAAAAFDPESFTWRTLDPPPIPVDEDDGEAILTRGAAVGGDGAAAFGFGWGASAITWDRATESWTAIDRLVANPGYVDLCADVTRQQLVAISIAETDPVGDESFAWTLDAGGDAWSEPAPLGVRVDNGSACGDGAIVVSDFDDDGSSVDLIDVATGAATPVYETDEVELWTPTFVGPWIAASTLTMETEGPTPPYEVRLARSGEWVPLDLPRGVGTSGAIWVPDVGFVAGGFDAGSNLVLWRAPEELQP